MMRLIGGRIQLACGGTHGAGLADPDLTGDDAVQRLDAA
jgi:hypothetical protein